MRLTISLLSMVRTLSGRLGNQSTPSSAPFSFAIKSYSLRKNFVEYNKEEIMTLAFAYFQPILLFK